MTAEQEIQQSSRELEQNLQTIDALTSVMSPELLQATLFEMKEQGNRTAECLWLSLQHTRKAFN